MDVLNSRYAKWLEDLVGAIVEYQPEKIGCVFYGEDGTVYTKYFGDCYPSEKAVMAHWINVDATMETVMANARAIVDEADAEREDYSEED